MLDEQLVCQQDPLKQPEITLKTVPRRYILHSNVLVLNPSCLPYSLRNLDNTHLRMPRFLRFNSLTSADRNSPQLITPLLQLILGTVTIGPWLLVLTYDLVLYIFRSLAYDIPFIGGRSRGSQRPRAPSFAERPSGRARTFSIPGIGSTGNEDEEGVKWRSRDAQKQADLGREKKD